MFNFLRLQYQMGKIDADKLREYCPKWITPEQFEEITGQPYAVQTAE